MKFQPALLTFLVKNSSPTKGLNKSETALTGPHSGLDSHPQKRNSCEHPTGEVTLLLGHRNSQAKINTSETREHLAGQEIWSTGRERVEEEGKESENEDKEKTQVLPQKLESIKGRQRELLGRAEKQMQVKASLM